MNDQHVTPSFDRFFNAPLTETDTEIAGIITQELVREQDGIELIASENIVSAAVMQAQGSVLTNKYAEGYPGKRYYGGCGPADLAESLAIERAKKLFSAGFANVQANSGSQANNRCSWRCECGGYDPWHVARGGRASHAWGGAEPVRQMVQRRAIWRAPGSGLLDYDELAALAAQHKPKLIIAGGSAYPRFIDFPRIRAIADAVGAYFMVDMAHFAGLVATGLYPSPLPHAHVVTTTTHKTLRGPRGGMVLTNHEDIAKKIIPRFSQAAGRPADACHRRQGGGFRGGAAAGFHHLSEGRGGQCQGARRNAGAAGAGDRDRGH